MKILVTGGLGFSGSCLVRELMKQGHELTIIDSMSRNKTLSEANWNEFAGKAKCYIGDIARDPSIVEAPVAGQDVIFHLAAVVNARLSVERPKETYDINVGGTVSLIEAARKNNIKKFIFASALAVYGPPKYLPYDENHPAAPLSPYGLSKLCSEQILRNYRDLYGINTISLRFSNIYGRGGAGVIPLFFDKITKGQPITIFGDGENTDDFINVADVVNGYILAMEKGVSPLYNISTGRTTSLNQLVELIEQACGRKAEIKREPAKPGEIRDARMDSTKARTELGWTPKVSLEDGLRTLLDVAG